MWKWKVGLVNHEIVCGKFNKKKRKWKKCRIITQDALNASLQLIIESLPKSKRKILPEKEVSQSYLLEDGCVITIRISTSSIKDVAPDSYRDAITNSLKVSKKFLNNG